MNRTVGVCGYVSTGSSAFSDLLREFNNTQVIDNIEFNLTYGVDGLEDLEYHLKKYGKYFHSVVAIDRFRKISKEGSYKRVTKDAIDKLTNEFLNKIIQVSWNGHSMYIDAFLRSSNEILAKRCFFKLAKLMKNNKLYKLYVMFFPYKWEFSIMSNKFDVAAKEYISSVLDSIGRKHNHITVLDQPFEGCNPIKSFKYFENPKAIVVDRDPRDHYLFVKNFLRPRGKQGYQIPCDNVDDYIKYFRLVRQKLPCLNERDDVIF